MPRMIFLNLAVADVLVLSRALEEARWMWQAQAAGYRGEV